MTRHDRAEVPESVIIMTEHSNVILLVSAWVSCQDQVGTTTVAFRALRIVNCHWLIRWKEGEFKACADYLRWFFRVRLVERRPDIKTQGRQAR